MRNLSLNFIPARLGLGRFRSRLKPYVTVAAGTARRPFKTPLGKVGTTGAYSWNSVHELLIDPSHDVVRVELWHRRLLRRDVLLGIGNLPLADLRAASQSGYAIDRWVRRQAGASVRVRAVGPLVPAASVTVSLSHCPYPCCPCCRFRSTKTPPSRPSRAPAP